MMHAYHCNRRNEKLPTEIDGYTNANSVSTGTDMKTLADYLLRRVGERRATLNAPIKISPSSTVSDNVSVRSSSVKSSKQSDTASVITTSLSSKRLDPETVKQRRSALQAYRDSLTKQLEEKRRELLDVCLKEYRVTGKLPPETPPLGDTQLPPVRKRPVTAGVQRRQSNLSVVKHMRNSVAFSPTNSPFDAFANSSPFQQLPISEVDESLVSHGSFRERNWTPPQTNQNAFYNTPSGSHTQTIGVVHRSPAYQPSPNVAGARLPAHLSVASNAELSRSLEDLNRNPNQNAYQPPYGQGGATIARSAARSETTRYQPSTLSNVRLLPKTENNYSQNAPTLTRRDAQAPDPRSSGAPRYKLKQAVSSSMTASVPMQQNYTMRSAASEWQSTRADSLSLGNDEVDAVSIASTQSGSLQDSGPSGASFAYTYDLHSRVAPHFVRVEVPAPPPSQVNPIVAPTEMVSLSSVQRTPSKSFSHSQSAAYASPPYAPASGDRNDSAEYVYKVIPAPESTSLDNSQFNVPQSTDELSQSPCSVTVLRTGGSHRQTLNVAQKRLSTSDTQLNQAGLSFPPEQAQPETKPYEMVTLSSRTSRPPTVSGTAAVQKPLMSDALYADDADKTLDDEAQDEVPSLRRSTQLNPPAIDVKLPVQTTVEVHRELFPGNYRQSTQFVSLAVAAPPANQPNFLDIFSNNEKERARGLGYVPEKSQFWYSGNSSLDENNEALATGLARPQPAQQPNETNRSGPNTKVLPRFV